jgi:1-acyl-sn-glycerol-3-phosphate acyltransferase
VRIARASIEKFVSSPNTEPLVPVLPTPLTVLFSPLPDLRGLDRILLRAMTMIGLHKVSSFSGLHHVGPDRDPFVLVLNHNSRHEALIVPALLFFLRGGRRIHFLADWNFRLIPGIDLLYQRAGVITVTRKLAKPRMLNAMKPFFTNTVPPLEQARQHLERGCSIAIFPEGAVNRNRFQLLRGRHGAARLSLETGAPIIPAGIRFSRTKETPADLKGQMEITVGPPLPMPSTQEALVTRANVRARHVQIMSAISVLSGKSWPFDSQEENNEAF